MGIHSGEPLLGLPKYVGIDVHRAARIMACCPWRPGRPFREHRRAARAGVSRGSVDLGERRLKDLSSPVRLYQLQIEGLACTFPPLRTLHRSNLPVPATPFLGRVDELRAVVARLTDRRTRLLTLIGPGGTGKTRLAIHAAAEAADSFPDGVFWVGLAPVREHSQVLRSVAHALGVAEEPGRALVETLADIQASRRTAVIVDNIEHLLPAAASSLATIADACPTTTVLATSRERLQLSMETVWPVPPLSSSDGELLFVERAHAAGVELEQDEAVAELCRRLDELPLAIELAAARTGTFSPAQLLERLSQRLDLEGSRDADPRQQTLRTTIDWSYDLLDREEQRLLARVSVFASCTDAAAAHVCDADPKTLQSLIDKSLLRRSDDGAGSRYWLLETIREYAAEKLAESGEAAAIHARLLAEQLGLVESVPFGGRDLAWLRRVDAEADNIVAVLSVGQPHEGHLRLATAPVDYWYWAGRLAEGRITLQRLLDEVPEIEETTRARAECVAGTLAMLQDDFDAALRLLDSAAVVAGRARCTPSRCSSCSCAA